VGYFSDILERQTSPWRLLLGKGTDRDKEILEEEKTKGLEALLTATKPFRMGANVLAQGYGPALRALMGRDPSTPGGLESLIREGVSTEEQDYLERKPYTAALKSGAGMAAALMPYASEGLGVLSYAANPLVNKSLQYGLRSGVPGALAGLSLSKEGAELRDTALGGGIGFGAGLLGGYALDPEYRGLVNEAYKRSLPVNGRYEAALSLGKEGKYPKTVNIQDRDDLEYLERILNKEQIDEIKSGKTTNFRGDSYEDLAKVNIVSEPPKTIEQKLSGKITDVNLRGNTFYHGTSSGGAKEIMQGGFKKGSELSGEAYRGGGYGKIQDSISLTEDPKVANVFAQLSKGGEVVEVKLKPNAKIVSIKGVDDAMDIEDYLPYLKKKGIDAVYLGGGEEELIVLDSKSIIPIKTSLGEFWKKAWGK